MPSRAPRIANPHPPTFFWQGALILLPAIVLCGFGLYSLRQDRALAEHQATEQARTIARETLQRIQRGPLQSIAEPERVERAKSGLAAPEDDPILQAARAAEPRVVFQVDDAGQVRYPPPLSPLPPPQPLDVEELNSEQKAAWTALQNSFGAEPFAGANDAALTAWRKTLPPRRFAAIADYEAGLACLKSERGNDATALFSGVAETAGGVLAEDGFPLAYFAQAQLLREGPFLQAGARKTLLDRFCNQAILAPNALSETALSWAVQYDLDGDAAKRWREVYAVHARARAIAAAMGQVENPADPLEVADEKYLLLADSTSGQRWIHAAALRELGATVWRVIQAQAIPEQFAVEVTLGKAPLLAGPKRADGAEPLAAANGQVTGARADLPLAVRVTLAEPARYYAAQRSRTLRFAALIGLSALAVSIGFFSARRAFRRQQRLSEMKTNFVSSVSHELRAPIASVRFMAEELELGAAPSPEKLRNYHRFIVQECRRLSAVIENVLDFSRREQGREQFEFEGSDLVRLLEETARLMRSYGSDSQVTITTAVAGEPAEVEADGRALQRLLVNLLDNAIKHSPEGGSVRTGLDFRPGHVALWVEDDGPGIPREEHERIFERFYRIGSELRRETQGVGLGLSIVKHIATVHGGTIRVRSEPGCGSRFTLELPIHHRSGFPALES
jgi:signal transduction histidine kinase